MIFFEFPIEPIAWGRPRVSRDGRFITSSKNRDYKERLIFMMRTKYMADGYRKNAFHDGQPMQGPIAVGLSFILKKPKRTKNNWPSVRPDIDNFAKIVLDSANGIFWLDDSQIVWLQLEKVYATHQPPHIQMWIKTIEEFEKTGDSKTHIA